MLAQRDIETHGGDPVELLTIREACARLKLSRASMYRLIARGELPTVRIGRARRIILEDLDNFVSAHRSRSGSPLAEPCTTEGGRACRS
jgi:excisionase family DNA binding protein